MRVILIPVITGLLASPTIALADYGNETPFPWMTTSAQGKFLFKMVPPTWRGAEDKPVTDRPPFGVAYQLTEDGKFKELWRADGWYGYRGKLSDDGRYLVVFGPWASDQKEHTDLAIAFYDKGKLLKQYAVRDLIREHDAVEESVSHYMWTPRRQTKPNGFDDGHFHLVVIDKTAYEFDYTTGEIASRTRDEGAKNSMDVQAEEEAEYNKKGLELLGANKFKEDYERYFEISDAAVTPSKDINCCLEGPTWSGRLTPKQKFGQQVSVSVEFPIREGTRVEVLLTPQQMIQAVEKALTHPFVKQQMEMKDATEITLFTLGDRLHWNTPELMELIKKSKGDKPDAVNQWAYFGINYGRPFHCSIYFNTDTGEIITGESPTWPGKICLIDSKGMLKTSSDADTPEPGILPDLE